jgi:glycosyltransferase involved in cell wall biosynthesis
VRNSSGSVIGIDCRFSSLHGGLGSYTRGLVDALIKAGGERRYVLFVTDVDTSWTKEAALHPHVRIVCAPFAHYSIAEQIRFPRLIAHSGVDRMFFPHFNVPLFLRIPFMCTVHDLILHRYPNGVNFFKRLAYKIVLCGSLTRAEKVIAVSQTTAENIRQYYPSISSRIHTILNGVDDQFRPATSEEITAVRAKYAIDRPFLLYVGNCKQHKNVSVLLKAFEDASLFGIDLVLASSGLECDCLSLPAHVRRISEIDQEDLPALYSAATASVTASLDEGFGLPALEAMRCRCPVLATNAGALPEICSSHALIVDPSLASVTEGLSRIVSDSSFRTPQALERAEQWSKTFTWHKAAHALITLLQK